MPDDVAVRKYSDLVQPVLGQRTVIEWITDDALPPFRMTYPMVKYSLSFILLPCVLVLLAANLLGQESGASTADPQLSNDAPTITPPQNEPLAAPRERAAVPPEPGLPAPDIVTPSERSSELEELLRRWEQQSAAIKTLHGKVTRFVYNTVLDVERRSEGEFWFEAPDKLRMDLASVKPNKGETSARIGDTGSPYCLEQDHSAKWICDGHVFFIVNDEEKTYETFTIREERGANSYFINQLLPVPIQLKAADIKRRFRFSLRTNSNDAAHLVAVPRTLQDKVNFEQVWIILDKTAYILIGVKLIDPSGNLETVYRFDDVKINDIRFSDGSAASHSNRT